MSGETVPGLIETLIAEQRAREPNRPALIGVAGAQGSGKTTALEALTAANPGYAQFSIDDVYFDTAQRAAFAARTHPLFVTRGPPGTHDIALARATIEALIDAAPDAQTPLPRFDKIADRLRPRAEWPVFGGRPDAILVDAWCLGALAPASIGSPLNPVEQEDSDRVWRRTQDDLLRGAYGDWFARFDAILYLRPPSWEIVRRWRGEQEVTLRKRALTAAEDAWIDRFIMHYERITRNMMAGAHRAKTIVQLDEARNVVGVEQRANPPTSAS